MAAREAFGPNLRRIRIQRGITLEQISSASKVGIELWEGLERNDFELWPSGIFARAYVRAYATAIGVDPESTVDEFCRWFPQGDRRAGRLMQGHAEIVGHSLNWQDEIPPGVREGDRRGGAAQVPARERARRSSALQQFFGALRRTIGRA